MVIPEEFNDIRPYEPEELPEVYDRLLKNPQFQSMVQFLFPEATTEEISQKMHDCKTSMDFQLVFAYRFLKKLVSKASMGIDMDISEIDNKRNYTFMSNHRDIVLDSALLDVLLIDAGFQTTCEIAIGDNLLSFPWVLDLVRLNKSFIVRRGLMARERLQASQKLSRYMHFAVGEKSQNLWIAQREGRAKDSDDRTQKGILKMIALGGEGDFIDRLIELHIAPLAISYEYDPCDFLKAQEYQLRRDNPEWKKGLMDDLVSMRIGIFGLKGRIHYRVAACIDDYLRDLRKQELSKTDLLDAICRHIDHEIHRNYRLYPNNYIAMDELDGTDHTDHYTEDDVRRFKLYLQSQLAKIKIPNKDEEFLRERLLTMYANPARNYIEATRA